MLLCNLSSKGPAAKQTRICAISQKKCHLVTFRIHSRGNLTLTYADWDTIQLPEQCVWCYLKCPETSRTRTWGWAVWHRTHEDSERPHHPTQHQMSVIKHLNCTTGKRRWSGFCRNATGNKILLAVAHALRWIRLCQWGLINTYLEIFFIFRQQAIRSWSGNLLQLLITVFRLLRFRLNLCKGLIFLIGDCGASEAFVSICFCFLKRWTVVCV